MPVDMKKLGWGDVKRAKRGDIFTIETASEHKHEHCAPGELPDKSAIAKNPFSGSHWAFVQNAKPEKSYRVRVVQNTGSRLSLQTIEEADTNGVILRKVERVDNIEEHSRKETIEWEGTPQSRLDPKHNERMNQGDVTGDKNDLLGGHL